MKYAVVYSSQTGNTRQLAEVIRDALPAEDCVYCGAPDPRAAGAELLFVGFWTDKGGCPAETADFLRELNGKRVALFGTAGFGADQSYFDAVLSRVRAQLGQGNSVEVGYMCQGRMPASVRARYEAMLAKDPADGNARRMIENFDLAASHPGEDDLRGAEEFARRLYAPGAFSK